MRRNCILRIGDMLGGSDPMNLRQSGLPQTTLWTPEKFNPATVTMLGEMAVVRKPKQMIERSRVLRHTTPPSRLNRKYALGFVPTMGSLHDGHMALIEASQAECVFTAVSIYVNPTQFGANEDVSKYPRNLERDLRILHEAGVDAVFLPNDELMYPPSHKMYVNYEGIETLPEAVSRPTHFRGVATICNKLFNIVQPNMVYVGQKDALQCVVLHRLIEDMHIPTQLTVCPVVREIDGLAMSSRNVYLSPEHRAEAPAIYAGLKQVKEELKKMVRSDRRETTYKYPPAKTIKEMLRSKYNESIKHGSLDYISIAKRHDMSEYGDDEAVENAAHISVVVDYNNTRLLDVVRVGMTEEEYYRPWKA